MWRTMLAPAHDLPLALIVWPRLYRFDAHADTQRLRTSSPRCPSLPCAPARRGASVSTQPRGQLAVVRCGHHVTQGASRQTVQSQSMPCPTAAPLW
jgi:hypothetical protein